MASIPAIELTDLSKRFPVARSLFPPRKRRNAPEVLAVDRVNLRVEDGEVFGLVGPNGAGKTTLVKLMCGLYLPSEGQAAVCGLDTVKDNFEVRKKIGLVTSNERSFFWRLSGWQNMEFFARLYGLAPAEASQWIGELFDLLGLTPVADARFDTYSTGTKQRFALVRGLLNKPRVLLMDEPTKGVDPRSASEIIKLIRERVIGLWNPTVFITSHNLREIELLCRRVAIMSHGGIIALGSIPELRRMTEPVDTYRMTVEAPAGSVAPLIERIVGVSFVRESPSGNGLRELEVKLQRNVDALPEVISTIVRSGGSIHRCSVVEPAFDEVFQAIVDRAIARPGGES